MEGSLRDAAACAHQDEAEGEAADDAGAGAMAAREDWFSRAAAVGRASAAESAALLARCISDKQRLLQHCAGSGVLLNILEFKLNSISVASSTRMSAFLRRLRAGLCLAMPDDVGVAVTGMDPSEPLEELHWLTRMAAHLLADSGEGETPLVPLAVAAAAAAADAQGGPDNIEQLSHALLGVAGLCLDEAARPVASPR